MLAFGKVLVGEAASYALTGQDAEFRIGYRPSGNTGTFVLTGQDAALNVVGNLSTGSFLIFLYD